MKQYLLLMLAVSLCALGACSFREAPEQIPPTAVWEEKTEPTEPLPPETESPTETEEAFAPEETLPPETEPVTEAPTEPEPTDPATGLPFAYGDTTPTWDPERAGAFPADADCSDRELLDKWLRVEGLTYADLVERGCSQLVLTVAQNTDGVETVNVCYERQPDGSWQAVPELSRLAGHVGKNGIKHNRVVNSYTSPAGLWRLGMAFGNSPEPLGLLLPWRDVTPQSDWICDPNSSYFNTWQERDDVTLEETWDYSEGEHLANYTRAYAYSCVIEFNTEERVPSRGCAIFLHCGQTYTAGCVSLPEADLVRILLWLNPARNPCILITGYQG